MSLVNSAIAHAQAALLQARTVKVAKQPTTSILKPAKNVSHLAKNARAPLNA